MPPNADRYIENRTKQCFCRATCNFTTCTLLFDLRFESQNSSSNTFFAFTVETEETWKWIKNSKAHKQKLSLLLKHGEEHPRDVKYISGVRVCCSEQFLIGKGCDGTRTYVGLGKDGSEKAVKCLRKDACRKLAEQEKKILKEPNAKRSNHVINYWFLDDEIDKDYLYLILDLCEENLDNFVRRTSPEEFVAKAPVIIKHILTGLADLHSNSPPILHRDIKPHNILRDINGNWLLADFGLSRLLAEGANSYASKPTGTPFWRAVESYPLTDVMAEKEDVRYKKESDIQVRFVNDDDIYEAHLGRQKKKISSHY